MGCHESRSLKQNVYDDPHHVKTTFKRSVVIQKYGGLAFILKWIFWAAILIKTVAQQRNVFRKIFFECTIRVVNRFSPRPTCLFSCHGLKICCSGISLLSTSRQLKTANLWLKSNFSYVMKRQGRNSKTFSGLVYL